MTADLPDAFQPVAGNSVSPFQAAEVLADRAPLDASVVASARARRTRCYHLTTTGTGNSTDHDSAVSEDGLLAATQFLTQPAPRPQASPPSPRRFLSLHPLCVDTHRSGNSMTAAPRESPVVALPAESARPLPCQNYCPAVQRVC